MKKTNIEDYKDRFNSPIGLTDVKLPNNAKEKDKQKLKNGKKVKR